MNYWHPQLPQPPRPPRYTLGGSAYHGILRQDIPDNLKTTLEVALGELEWARLAWSNWHYDGEGGTTRVMPPNWFPESLGLGVVTQCKGARSRRTVLCARFYLEKGAQRCVVQGVGVYQDTLNNKPTHAMPCGKKMRGMRTRKTRYQHMIFHVCVSDS